MSYSEGGTDYPLDYGTPLPAPGAGRLVVNGWVGTAGRRSTLWLDEPSGPMVAVVFQHQSRFGVAGHYDEGQTLGWSGASASGRDYGGQVHLHIHGLNAGGKRVDFTLYSANSAVASFDTSVLDTSKPVTPLRKENTMRLVAGQPSNRRVALGELTWQVLPGEQASHSAHVWESPSGGPAHGEPLVIDDATLDLEIGQIQQRRAQLARAFNSLRA
ncbi:hypothetical protein E3T26_14470 [Cryobacterium sp. TMT1-21]|uniref:hypothetical protein n=1 Tax=Cryobacterium sp. TMT1-21 TaxID=1259234 RepID=UPI0010699EEA|nr:hypothetical protein [Cryobacterium sp. TMT1-21]TFD09829.1 hypothetical protein E3T26_14470 [Cryobacterium sp. TMT1-21]